MVWHQRGRLDVEQGRCHQDEVRGDLEVELAHGFALPQVLVGNLGYGDGADGHLLAAHQLQEQVERSRVGLCPDAVRHLDPQERTVEPASRGIEVEPERVEAQDARKHVQQDEQDGHGIALHLVVPLARGAREEG